MRAKTERLAAGPDSKRVASKGIPDGIKEPLNRNWGS